MDARATPKSTSLKLSEFSHTTMIHAATCDACNERIVGARYKCCMCGDFDLCEKCETSHNHDPEHIFLKASFSIRGGPPRSFSLPKIYPVRPRSTEKYTHQKNCHYCKMPIIGARYICVDCTLQTDLCTQCESYLKHADHHMVVKVVYPISDDCSCILRSKLSVFDKPSVHRSPSPPTTMPKGTTFVSPTQTSPFLSFNKALPLKSTTPEMQRNTHGLPHGPPHSTHSVLNSATSFSPSNTTLPSSPLARFSFTPSSSPIMTPMYPPFISIASPQSTIPSTTPPFLWSSLFTSPSPAVTSIPSIPAYNHVAPPTSFPPIVSSTVPAPTTVCISLAHIGSNIEIRKIQANDIRELLEVEVESFPTNALTSNYFQEAVASDECCVFVADDTFEHCVVGYISYRRRWYKRTIRIESLAVLKRCRGKKIGDRLLAHCLDYLSKYHQIITLHVHQQNTIAYAMYLKHGFQVVDEVKGYYSDEEKKCKNSGDAFLMHKMC